jgi:hypothetical protein
MPLVSHPNKCRRDARKTAHERNGPLRIGSLARKYLTNPVGQSRGETTLH